MRRCIALLLFAAAFGLALCATARAAETPDEFKIKREEVFAFAQEPAVTRSGDRVSIKFETKAACDVTVAIEDNDGRVVRHLASGVLGKNAPPPFQKGSLAQTVVWDSKDDAGRYIDDKDSHTVRVSLGLKPQFERTLFWSPQKRMASGAPIVCATPEGVYVYDGEPTDSVRMYDHKGDYVRTVYPFPSDKVAQVDGLEWHTFPQDGAKLPIKGNFLQTTMLTSGVNAIDHTYKPDKDAYDSVVSSAHAHFGMYAPGVTAMAVRNGRIALASMRLNRLGTDGSSGGMKMNGPGITYKAQLRQMHEHPGGVHNIGPRNAALSPDGRWAYLSCYFWNQAWNQDGHHGVVKVDMQSDAEPVLFAGSMKQNDRGTENGKFCYATGIAVDAKGRVYVGDYMNDRVQVFDSEGKHLKNIPVEKPVEVCLHQKTGEIYVFSWLLGNYQIIDEEAKAAKQQKVVKVKSAMTRFASFDDPKQLSSCPLPWGKSVEVHSYMGVIRSGLQYRVELDGYTDPPMVWMVPGAPFNTGYGGERKDEAWAKTSLHLYQVKDGNLDQKRDFGKDAEKAIEQLRPPVYGRQRLYVNPKTGNLYIGEGSPPDGTGNEKAFFEMIEVNPESGKIKMIPLPYDAEDVCFDQDGLIYLRERAYVGRFDFRSWREVPWDYGEEQESVGFASGRGGKRGQLMAGLPVFKGINWHMGGLSVSKKGMIAVSCYTKESIKQRTDERSVDVSSGTPYAPRIYPGRVFGHKRALIHVWDKHGQVKYEDAVPGLPDLYGLEIDEHDDLYLLSAATRVFDGKRYYNDMAGTLMKFRPKNAKVLSDGAHDIKLPDASKPKRPIDVISSMQGGAWIEGAEWMFGGAGFGGKNRGVGCACWSGKFALDYYARSFAPETDRYSVAVLDSAGNVILRIGKYGNVDDGKPLVADGGPPQPRSLGGDEVGLFHGAYLATHTDRRLFIADPCNFRVLGVALSYHDERKVALKTVKDGE